MGDDALVVPFAIDQALPCLVEVKLHRHTGAVTVAGANGFDNRGVLLQHLLCTPRGAGAREADGQPHEAGHRFVRAVEHTDEKLVVGGIGNGAMKGEVFLGVDAALVSAGGETGVGFVDDAQLRVAVAQRSQTCGFAFERDADFLSAQILGDVIGRRERLQA